MRNSVLYKDISDGRAIEWICQGRKSRWRKPIKKLLLKQRPKLMGAWTIMKYVMIWGIKLFKDMLEQESAGHCNNHSWWCGGVKTSEHSETTLRFPVSAPGKL